MRRALTTVCLASALALSFSHAAEAQTKEELKAQLKVLQKQLDALKRANDISSTRKISNISSECITEAIESTENEEYRFTYVGRLVVPTKATSSRTSRVANILAANGLVSDDSNVELNLSGVRRRGNTLSTRNGNKVTLNLDNLTGANGNNVTLSVPSSVLSRRSGRLSRNDNDRALLSVNRSTLRNGARRLSAIQRASKADHQIVTDGNFVSGIYRGGEFSSAPSAENPFVGRYVQSGGQFKTVMAVGQQFIVTP